jgi:NitT/TauT family transport system substrate-binding protein
LFFFIWPLPPPAAGESLAAAQKSALSPDYDSIPFVQAKQKGLSAEKVELVVFMSPMDRTPRSFAVKSDGTISDVLAVCQAKDGGFDVAITSGTNGCTDS